MRRDEMKESKWPIIQQLRGLAVLAVILFHAGSLLPGGFLGVDIFFAVSGFVITKVLIKDVLNHGKLNVKKFFKRRFYRLFPALFVMVICTLVLSSLLQNPFGPFQIALMSGVLSLFGFSNLYFGVKAEDYFDQSNAGNPFLHTWSLGVESQFYAGFAVLVFLITNLSQRNKSQISRRILAVLVVLGFTSFLVAIAGNLDLYQGPGRSLLGFYSPFSRAWEFLFGSIIFLLRLQFNFRTFKLQNLFLVGLGLTIIFYDSGIFPNSLWALMTLLLVGLILLQDLEKSFIGGRLLNYLGNASYSIYLWHWPLIVLASISFEGNLIALVVALLLSIFFGTTSFKFIETPRKRNKSTSLVASVAACAGIFVVVFILANGKFFQQGVGGDFSSASKLANQLTESSGLLTGGCRFDGVGIPDACHVSFGNKRPIYLVGDSEAEQIVSGLKIFADENDFPLSVAVTLGCPFNEFSVFPPGSYSERRRCSKYFESTMARLTTSEPGIVVIANSDQYFVADNWQVSVNGGKHVQQIDRISAYKTSSAAIFEALGHRGHKIVLVETIPQFRNQSFWDWSLCSRLALLENSCQKSITLKDYKYQTLLYASAQSELSSKFGIRLADLSPFICEEGICSNVRNGNLIYKDSMHISEWQSKKLSIVWSKFIY